VAVWLRAGAHVDLVGGFTLKTLKMRESDDEVVRRGRLFADTLRFTLTTCGDYATPIAKASSRPTSVDVTDHPHAQRFIPNANPSPSQWVDAGSTPVNLQATDTIGGREHRI
jgi:hypothetical protein